MTSVSTGPAAPADGVAKTPPEVPIWQLFKYASGRVRLLLVLAVLMSVVDGMTLPLRNMLIGKFTDLFASYGSADGGVTGEHFMKELWGLFVLGCWMALGSWATTSLHTFLWMYTAEVQSRGLRQIYHRAALNKSAIWREQHPSTEVIALLTNNVQLFQEGVGQKFGLIIKNIATFIFGLASAFYSGWQLSLVILVVFPCVGAVLGIMWGQSNRMDRLLLESYNKAAKKANEVFTSLRTVVSFNRQHQETQEYISYLADMADVSRQHGVVIGFGWGMYNFTMFVAFAVSFGTGGYLLSLGIMTAGDVLNAFTQIAFGITGLGNLGQYTQAISQARAAAAPLFDVIESEPAPAGGKGKKLPSSKNGELWEIRFENVSFAYPSRPDHLVLDKFSVTIPAGSYTALIARIGSGKSTLFHLLLRVYTPLSGAIYINGHDIQQLDVHWLREQIAVVSQDMALFDGSIEDNVRLGAPDPSKVTHEQVVAVCKLAQADAFISNLEHGYRTELSAWNNKVSGGQKQRIVIARALLQAPKVLLLDEATSALDAQTEASVEESFNFAASGRTTLVISHRPRAVENCTFVVAIKDGQVAEHGTPAELDKVKDSYYAQMMAAFKSQPRTPSASKSASLASLKSIPRPRTPESTVDEAAVADQTNAEKTKHLTYDRLYGLLKPSIGVILFGLVGSFMEGLLAPLQGMVMAGVIASYSRVEVSAEQPAYVFWSICLLGLGVWALLYHLIIFICYRISSARLVKHLREELFQAILRQDQAFFDRQENAPGKLAARLATDMSSIERMAGGLLGDLLRASSVAVLCLAIVLYSSWQMTLLMLLCVPAIAIATLVQSQTLSGYLEQARTVYEKPTQLAAQLLAQSRHVALLSKEEWFSRMFEHELEGPFRQGVRRSLVTSLTAGLQDSLLIVIFSVGLLFGGSLVTSNAATTRDILTVMITITISALNTASLVQGIATGFSQGWSTLEYMLAIIDRVPLINADDDKGHTGDDVRRHPNSHVAFEKVTFAYPERPAKNVVRDVSFDIRPGQFIGVVGHSGSGKSTLISLVQRLYDPASGAVLVDGVGAKQWQVRALRRQIGIVTQEADLFDVSVRDNIAYGRVTASQSEIEHAAKQAGAHQFIVNLPQGYNTRVGERGSMLSGGQRQMVALARALLLDPRILLLDEATSALDAESEQLVQAALQREHANRTIIAVAHRIQSIAQADCILVFDHGELVEQGQHDDLVELNGVYARLVEQQQQTSTDN